MMVGPARSNKPAATAPKTEMITLASGASYPAFLEPLTKNETALLDMYEKIKHYEKEAARLKAEEAKRRLEEADRKYKEKLEEQNRLEGGDSDADGDDDKKPQGKAAEDYHDDDSDMESDHDDDSDEEEEQDEEAKERRRKRKEGIKKLRNDVKAQERKEAAKKAKNVAEREKQEAMVQEMLGKGANKVTLGDKRSFGHDGEDDDDESDYEANDGGMSMGRVVKKQRNAWDDDKPKPSLIANLGGNTTPVHDFSKKLGMSKVSLDGSVMFPIEGNLPWTPPDQPRDFLDGHLELELPDFDSSAHGGGNNTIAVKFHAPQESKRFSINIAMPGNNGYNDILFHFNPRHFQRGGHLVINDRKETIWGNDISVPLSTMPMMYSVESCTLIVQINEEGFDVFVEGQHCARLEHRTPMPKKKGPLMLQFPSSDDYGNPENWMVYRVWWGRKASMADDLNGVAGVNIYSSVHPKKLFVSGLSKLRSEPEVELRRAELERAFRKYGGPSGAVLVSVQKGSTFAFVEVYSEQQADLALVEQRNKYKLNKARRTKHEALMEERAANEAKGSGDGSKKESNVDWD